MICMTTLPTTFPAYYIADDNRIFVVPSADSFDRFVQDMRIEAGLSVAETLARYPLFPTFEAAEAAGGRD